MHPKDAMLRESPTCSGTEGRPRITDATGAVCYCSCRRFQRICIPGAFEGSRNGWLGRGISWAEEALLRRMVMCATHVQAGVEDRAAKTQSFAPGRSSTLSTPKPLKQANLHTYPPSDTPFTRKRPRPLKLRTASSACS